jgi:hypothetical protein
MTERKLPHPFVRDGWLSDDEPEHATVCSCHIANVTRATDGIRAISRIVHNSLGEPDATGAEPLGRGVEMNLLDALECLGDYIFEQMESMRATAALHAKWEREREVSNV